MNPKEKNPWKAGFALLRILAYGNYLDYDHMDYRDSNGGSAVK